MLQAGKGDIYGIRFEVAQVSEPGSLAMLTAGLLGIGVFSRRRRVDAGRSAVGLA